MYIRHYLCRDDDFHRDDDSDDERTRGAEPSASAIFSLLMFIFGESEQRTTIGFFSSAPRMQSCVAVAVLRVYDAPVCFFFFFLPSFKWTAREGPDKFK